MEVCLNTDLHLKRLASLASSHKLSKRYDLRGKILDFNLSSQCLQNYDRIHQIGEGTYGTVYRCYVKGTHDVVAIKKYKESDEGGADAQARIFLYFEKRLY
jgi:serine/threonine protein kinase